MALDLPDVPETSYKEIKEKQDRKGILYISCIPPGMTPNFVKRYFADYGIQRVYFVPETEEGRKKRVKNGGSSKRRYNEGWMEFEDKQMAKKVIAYYSGKQVGGKKRHNEFHDDLWVLKYLSGFKWENLTEKFLYERKMREHRLKAELSQSKKEIDFVVDKVEWSRRLQKKIEKENNKNEKISNEYNKEDEHKEEEKHGNEINTKDEKQEKGEIKQKKEKSVGLLKKRLGNFKQRAPIRPIKEIIEDDE